MTLDPQSWLPQAQELALGERRTCQHDCGDGPKLVIEHKPTGWAAWCYRCSEGGWHPAPQPSMAERIARLRAANVAEAEAERDVRPPMPAKFDPSLWPLHARVWLYKAGLSNDDIRTNGFYYCGRLERVVLPIYDAGRVIFWQARGFDPSRPKYLNPPVDRTALAPLWGSALEARLLVLTEDVLSGVRVGSCTLCRCLLGTALSDRVCMLVAAHKLPVGVWLDPDAPGRRASAKIVRKLKAFGVEAFAIHTDSDPKFLSRQEIAAVLTTSERSNTHFD